MRNQFESGRPSHATLRTQLEQDTWHHGTYPTDRSVTSQRWLPAPEDGHLAEVAWRALWLTGVLDTSWEHRPSQVLQWE